MARAYGVELHTHTAENAEDVAYCRERFRCEPVELMERLALSGDPLELLLASWRPPPGSFLGDLVQP